MLAAFTPLSNLHQHPLPPIPVPSRCAGGPVTLPPPSFLPRLAAPLLWGRRSLTLSAVTLQHLKTSIRMMSSAEGRRESKGRLKPPKPFQTSCDAVSVSTTFPSSPSRPVFTMMQPWRCLTLDSYTSCSSLTLSHHLFPSPFSLLLPRQHLCTEFLPLLTKDCSGVTRSSGQMSVCPSLATVTYSYQKTPSPAPGPMRANATPCSFLEQHHQATACTLQHCAFSSLSPVSAGSVSRCGFTRRTGIKSHRADGQKGKEVYPRSTLGWWQGQDEAQMARFSVHGYSLYIPASPLTLCCIPSNNSPCPGQYFFSFFFFFRTVFS